MEPAGNIPVSIYIHIPFCRKKCGYCDFFSVTEGKSFYKSVLDKILMQLRSYISSAGVRHIHTVFIGGGTPSSIPLPLLDWFLGSLVSILPSTGKEFTVEINPEDAEYPLFEVLKKHGVDRLSIGIQSLNDSTLKVLGRNASKTDTFRALESSAANWKGKKSFDIITAVPGQKAEDTLDDLKTVIGFNPDHVSLYTLTFEENTPLTVKLKQGSISKQSEASEIRIFNAAIDLLEKEGYRRYEISNFAKPGAYSIHNSAYWNMSPYFGAGPSAVSTIPGKAGPVRIENPRDIPGFLSEDVNGHFSEEIIRPASFLLEHLLTGFRLTRGISIKKIGKIFDIDFAEYFSSALSRWNRFLSWDDEYVSLNRKGLQLLDSFLSDIASEIDYDNPAACRWPAEEA